MDALSMPESVLNYSSQTKVQSINIATKNYSIQPSKTLWRSPCHTPELNNNHSINNIQSLLLVYAQCLHTCCYQSLVYCYVVISIITKPTLKRKKKHCNLLSEHMFCSLKVHLQGQSKYSGFVVQDMKLMTMKQSTSFNLLIIIMGH